MNPKEILNMSIGQSGVQMSNATWELLCIEHGFDPSGLAVNAEAMEYDTSYRTFFGLTPSGHYVPRHILVDLEPTVIDEIASGPYKQLYHPERMIKGQEDAGNNFARGHFTKGKSIWRRVEDAIRKVIEQCDFFQGFFITHSYGGGTGSGFTALMLDRLFQIYSKKARFSMAVFPSPRMSTAVVEPYNSVLLSHSAMECTDISILMDNESLYDLCAKQLECVSPTYVTINRLVSQIVSAMTASLRFESSVNNDLDSMMVNLVPYPRLHFPLVNYAPILSVDKANHSGLSVAEITRDLFEQSSQTLQCNIPDGKYMACSMQFRGHVSPREVNTAVLEIKGKDNVKFVDWCPTGFKIGINSMIPTFVPNSNMAKVTRNATMVTNNTAICEVIQKMMRKFDMLFSKRAMVHHYVGEGMEEGEFTEAKEDYAQLIKDYLEAALPTTADGEVAEEENDYFQERKSPVASPGENTKSPKMQRSQSGGAKSGGGSVYSKKNSDLAGETVENLENEDNDLPGDNDGIDGMEEMQENNEEEYNPANDDF